MLPVFADTAAVQQLGEEKKGFRVSDTGVLEELGERFGQSPLMRRRSPGFVHVLWTMRSHCFVHCVEEATRLVRPPGPSRGQLEAVRTVRRTEYEIWDNIIFQPFLG